MVVILFQVKNVNCTILVMTGNKIYSYVKSMRNIFIPLYTRNDNYYNKCVLKDILIRSK